MAKKYLRQAQQLDPDDKLYGNFIKSMSKMEKAKAAAEEE